MGGKRILSDEQLEAMIEMREAGRSYEQIRRHFAAKGTIVSIGSISWQCLRLGVDCPTDRRKPLCVSKAAVYERASGSVRQFSADEDRQLIALEAEGLPLNQIAVRLGRKNNSIRGRLYTLARHDARAENGAIV